MTKPLSPDFINDASLHIKRSPWYDLAFTDGIDGECCRLTLSELSLRYRALATYYHYNFSVGCLVSIYRPEILKCSSGQLQGLKLRKITNAIHTIQNNLQRILCIPEYFYKKDLSFLNFRPSEPKGKVRYQFIGVDMIVRNI